ncbi:hypothetical protein WJX73_008635 [Symbiochloris irregularis]|uniref:Uncharacterized protein n=1 Tax=Symbiochloris irregularis TaxID=706552 RepID=A0AAW1NMX3_9CHLO
MEEALTGLYEQAVSSGAIEDTKAYSEGMLYLAETIETTVSREDAVRFNFLLCQQLIPAYQGRPDSDSGLLEEVLFDALGDRCWQEQDTSLASALPLALAMMTWADDKEAVSLLAAQFMDIAREDAEENKSEQLAVRALRVCETLQCHWCHWLAEEGFEPGQGEVNTMAHCTLHLSNLPFSENVRREALQCCQRLLSSVQAPAMMRALEHLQRQGKQEAAMALQHLNHQAASCWPAPGSGLPAKSSTSSDSSETEDSAQTEVAEWRKERWAAIRPTLLPAATAWLRAKGRPQGWELCSQLPEHAEVIMSALNLLRFMLLRERSGGTNHTMITEPGILLHLREATLQPLQAACKKCLNMLRLQKTVIEDRKVPQEIWGMIHLNLAKLCKPSNTGTQPTAEQLVQLGQSRFLPVAKWLDAHKTGVSGVHVSVVCCSYNTQTCPGRHEYLAALLGSLKSVPVRLHLNFTCGGREHFFMTQLSQRFLKDLSSSMTSLSLSCRMSTRSITALAQLTRLTQLDLTIMHHKCAVSQADLAALGRMQALQTLQLRFLTLPAATNTSQLQYLSLEFLQHSPITQLKLAYTPTILENAPALASLQQLTLMGYHSQGPLAVPAVLSSLCALSRLELDGVQLTGNLQGLSTLPQLSELHLEGVKGDDESSSELQLISAVGNMSKLRSLFIANGCSSGVDASSESQFYNEF